MKSLHDLDALEGPMFAGDDPLVRPGALDGVIIMRYAHIERNRSSGGVEQYLRHLHQGLLHRHRMTVLQMHMTRDGASDVIDIEHVGIGRILWVPVPTWQAESGLADMPRRLRYMYQRKLRLRQQSVSVRKERLFAGILDLFRLQSHLRHRTAVLSDHLADLLVEHKVNLLVMHWMNYDADALLECANVAKIPFALINHFDNARLALPRYRKWITSATAIGTVSSQGIPDYLRGRYVDLSDAVDTDFFSPEKAAPMSVQSRPMILLPARIDTGKGHLDLMEATRILISRNVDVTVCFAGAVESEPLHRELRRSIIAMGLKEHVHFVGEKSAEEIRDLYALSTIVVLPSHSEGLGRVLLEAQAMGKPVVAYDCGGMSEAILPNRTGFLVEKGNVEALARKIGLLLENESERLRLGREGREFVARRFGFPALVQRHEAFYCRALYGNIAKCEEAVSGRQAS
jgi:glycosyltransferase involved in cell wall biosynthesis